MISRKLKEFYKGKGLQEKEYHIGPEHPGLEQKAITLLQNLESPNILEIGYQSGGFAVPVIYELCGNGAKYYGIDNMEFNASIDSKWKPELIKQFLSKEGVSEECFQFYVGDSRDYLKKTDKKFDLILIDHLKALYPRDLKIVFSRKLLTENGVVLLHDVSKRAKLAWQACSKICDTYGYSYIIDEDIVSGLAIVTFSGKVPNGILESLKRNVHRFF